MWCLVRMLWIVWLPFLFINVHVCHSLCCVMIRVARHDTLHMCVCIQFYMIACRRHYVLILLVRVCSPHPPPSTPLHTQCHNSKHDTVSCCTHTHAVHPNIQFICTSCWLCPVLTMSHPIFRMVGPHWCWQLVLVTFQWPDSWWRRTIVMWMRRMVKWVDGSNGKSEWVLNLCSFPHVTKWHRKLEHKIRIDILWSRNWSDIFLCNYDWNGLQTKMFLRLLSKQT